jgi:hypothetical protein
MQPFEEWVAGAPGGSPIAPRRPTPVPIAQRSAFRIRCTPPAVQRGAPAALVCNGSRDVGRAAQASRQCCRPVVQTTCASSASAAPLTTLAAGRSYRFTYGDAPQQFCELHLPPAGTAPAGGGEAGGAYPVAVCIHGGAWKNSWCDAAPDARGCAPPSARTVSCSSFSSALAGPPIR